MGKSVADGKKLVANAISDKGVATETNDSFEIMANNIASIQSKNTSFFVGYADGNHYIGYYSIYQNNANNFYCDGTNGVVCPYSDDYIIILTIGTGGSDNSPRFAIHKNGSVALEWTLRPQTTNTVVGKIHIDKNDNIRFYKVTTEGYCYVTKVEILPTIIA